MLKVRENKVARSLAILYCTSINIGNTLVNFSKGILKILVIVSSVIYKVTLVCASSYTEVTLNENTTIQNFAIRVITRYHLMSSEVNFTTNHKNTAFCLPLNTIALP